jgi:hypothetical protein
MSTIGSQINHGIVLGTTGYTSPLTITSSGGVSNGTPGNAIFGGTATVVNHGKIIENGAGTSDLGIYLTGAGSFVDNRGAIISDGNAVGIYGPGGVSNSGTITAGHWGITSRDTFSIINTGTILGS